MSTQKTPNPATEQPATAPASPSIEDQQRADIDAHAPRAGVPFDLAGHTFTIHPLKVKQVFPFLAVARPVLAALSSRPSSPPSGLPPTEAGPGQGGSSTEAEAGPAPADAVLGAFGDADWMLGLLEEHGPSLLKALAIGVEPNQSPESQRAMHDQLEDLPLVDVVTLLKHFVVVNADFFTQRGLKLPPLNLPSAAAVGVKRASRKR